MITRRPAAAGRSAGPVRSHDPSAFEHASKSVGALAAPALSFATDLGSEEGANHR
jgi:hypothetical protein